MHIQNTLENVEISLGESRIRGRELVRVLIICSRLLLSFCRHACMTARVPHGEHVLDDEVRLRIVCYMNIRHKQRRDKKSRTLSRFFVHHPRSPLAGKPRPCLIPQDIEGTESMPLHRDTNKPDRQLFHDDIDGSHPRNKWLFRTTRCVNPLEPRYILPSYSAAAPVAPKFTRDAHDVSDIEGTRSRPLYPLAPRQNQRVDDIEGARSGWRPRHIRARHDNPPLDHSLNVSDITAGGFRTRRATNPLTPSYRVNGMDIADDPIKSRPRTLPKARDTPFYPLTTADIEGAQSGWRPLPQVNPPVEARRHFRNTNYMGDIPGAQADTVKHSICTDRHVNPLNPMYASLDGELLANPQTPLYEEPANTEAEAQLDRAIAAEEAAAVVGSHTKLRQDNEKIFTNNQDEHELLQEQPARFTQRRRPASEPLRSGREQIGSSMRSDGRNSGRVRDEREREDDFRTQHDGTDIEAYARESSLPDAGNTPGRESEKERRIRRLEEEVRSLRKRAGESRGTPSPSAAAAVAAIAGAPGQEEWGACRKAACSSSGESRGGLCEQRKPPLANAISNRTAGSRSLTPGKLRLLSSSVSEGGGGGSDARDRPKSTRSAGSTGDITRRPSARSWDTEAKRAALGRGGARVGDEARKGAMMLRSGGGEPGSQRVDRLVLRSSSGTPRVPLTPSERRSAREYVDDVSSVRDLL